MFSSYSVKRKFMPNIVSKTFISDILDNSYEVCCVGNAQFAFLSDPTRRIFTRPSLYVLNAHPTILLYSLSLRSSQLRVSTKALRTIELRGGLDGYLRHYSHEVIDSTVGAPHSLCG